MEAALHLLGSVAMVPAVVDDVKNDGAVKMIMSAMDKNANEEEILELGAAALQGLVSSEDGAMEAYVTQIEALTASLIGNPDQTLPIMKTTLNIMNQLALVRRRVEVNVVIILHPVCVARLTHVLTLRNEMLHRVYR